MDLERELSELARLRSRGLLTEDEHRARRAMLIASAPPTRDGGGDDSVLALAATGGIAGIVFATIALFVGDVASDEEIVGLGVSALLAAITGIVAGALHYRGFHRNWSAAGLVVAAIWHLVSISLFGLPGFALLLAAGVVAFVHRE